MRLACVGEGETEWVCVPRIAGNLGHTIIFNAHAGGCSADWEYAVSKEILPFVLTAALKRPDKILVVLDREDRPGCCGELAGQARQLLVDGLTAKGLQGNVAVVVSNKKFEAIIMADYELVDTLPCLARPVCRDFGPALDGKNPLNVIKPALRSGKTYHKLRDGGYLASRLRLDSPVVYARSKCLRKLVRELPSPVFGP
jgi:hypothetical protein